MGLPGLPLFSIVSPHALIAFSTSSSLGGGKGWGSLRLGPSNSARSSMIGNFLSCSSGMKLAAVTTCATSGSWPTRSANDVAPSNVIGSFIRSRAVETDSVSGFFRLSGSKSKAMCGNNPMLIAASSTAPPMIHCRRSMSHRSSGAARRKPIASGSPRGRTSVSRAGKRRKLSAIAITIPQPAIQPKAWMPV